MLFGQEELTDLVITGLTVTIGDEAVKEVEIVDDAQTKIALILGKITMGTEDPPVPTVWQAWTTSAIATHGLMNGVAVRVLEAAPTAASVI